MGSGGHGGLLCPRETAPTRRFWHGREGSRRTTACGCAGKPHRLTRIATDRQRVAAIVGALAEGEEGFSTRAPAGRQSMIFPIARSSTRSRLPPAPVHRAFQPVVHLGEFLLILDLNTEMIDPGRTAPCRTHNSNSIKISSSQRRCQRHFETHRRHVFAQATFFPISRLGLVAPTLNVDRHSVSVSLVASLWSSPAPTSPRPD